MRRAGTRSKTGPGSDAGNRCSSGSDDAGSGGVIFGRGCFGALRLRGVHGFRHQMKVVDNDAPRSLVFQ